MKTTNGFLAIAIILSIIITSCKLTPNKGTTTTTPQGNTTIDEIVQIPSDFIKNYTIEKEEDLSYNGIIRTQLRISIPSGLTKEDIGNNIKHVVIECFKKNESDGISILVYEKGDNIESAYTVAMGEFAPMGDWSLIKANANLLSFKLNLEYKEAYFKPKILTFKVGDKVKLYKETAWSRKERKMVKVTSVPLSNSINAWTDEYIIVNIPNNTLATIIDIHKEKLTDGSEFIRYKVETQYNGEKYTGWIHNDEVIK